MKAFRLGDVFKVYTAERRLDQLDGANDVVRSISADAQRNGIDPSEELEQQCFALHDRQTGLRSDVAQPQNARTIRHDRDGIGAVRIGEDCFGL